MQIEQFSDILEWTANYHKALAEQLHCCCKKTDLNKLVLDYLAMHENHLSKLILAFKNIFVGSLIPGSTESLSMWTFTS